MNVTCSATNVCTTILNSSCVYYTGDDLIYTGILTNDNLTAALEKINAKFQDAGLGYIFENGITQAVPGDPVKLGGVLTGDTVITSSGYNFTITEDLIVGSVAITGGLPTEFLKADGSLDSTTYQVAGNYLTALTGDGVASGPGSAAFTLATVNLSPGTFGDQVTVPVVTVNAKGLVTSVTTTAINLPPTLASFSGDVTGIGNINVPITLTLNTVNSNVYGSNTFLRFAVNGKGLVTSATPVTAGNIYGVLGYTPVTNARTLTINGVTKDLTTNRTWTIDSLPVQTGSNGKWLTTNGVFSYWSDLYGNISQFNNDVGYLDYIPTFDQVLASGSVTGYSLTAANLTSLGLITAVGEVTANFYKYTDGSTIGNVISVPRAWAFPDADGIIPLSVNGVIADSLGEITIPIGGGSVTEVIGTGSVNGITLSGNVTSSGELLLSGYIVLDSIQVTDALGYIPYDASNPNLFATVFDLVPYITTADANSTFYPIDNPNGFITINSIYSLSDEIIYNNGAIYINGNYYVPNYSDVANWNSAYNGRIVAVTNDGSSGVASYNYSTNVLNIPEYTLAGLGGITATFLSAVAPELSYDSGTGVIEHNTTDGYLHVPATGTTNNGKFLKAGASPGVFSWETVDLSLESILNTDHDLTDDLNFQGTNAGFGNTGANNVNAFGNNAANSNSGSNINALGQDSARNNSGDYVNALGYQAGFNNTHSYVNLLGLGAAATGDNQTVLAGQTYSARLSYNSLTANVTHTLPNATGTYVLSVNGINANSSGAITVPAVTSVAGVGTVSGLTLTGTVNYGNPAGNLTLGGTLTLTSGQVTTALGFTPYNATNPNNYIAITDLSSTATGLTYNNTTGVFSLTAGYSIPTTASQTNWDVAYNNRVTSVSVTPGTGISASVATGTTTPNITITNTAPDQTVVLNNGTGIAVTGTYPNFTITNTSPSTGGTVTSVSASVPTILNVSVNTPTTTPNIVITAAGNSSQYMRGDGQLAPLPIPSAGGGSNVTYYMNGSVNSSVGGYKQLSKDAIVGSGTNFTLTNTAAYMASFLTGVGDPALLSIPSGTWEFNINFSSSNNTDNPSFYVQLYKYDGSTFTQIGSNSATITISGGTTNTTYTATISVPTTTITLLDRLAIRVYVNTDGNRTITMYTEGSYLARTITTFAKGITVLNTLTAQVQDFAVGTSGTDFNISSTTATHTFNIPDASATARGVVTTGAQTIAGAKTFSSTIVGSITGNAGTATSASTWTTARSLAGNSVDGSSNVNFTNKFIVQGTSDSGLSGAQFLGNLGDGILKNTTSTGVLSIAQADVDYLAPLSISSYSGSNVRVITYDNKGRVTGGTNASASNLSNGTTGTGAIVLANTPTLTSPIIGDATGTSLSVTGQLTSTIATGTAPLVVTSTTEVANLRAATATTATNIAGGSIGAIPYQTGAGTTAFSTTVAAAGLPLLSGTAGTGQPSYGVLGFSGGGTGTNNRQDALNALANSVVVNRFLKGDGSNVVMSPISVGDIPNDTYNISISGTAAGITATANANTFYAGPTTGGAASPTFRQLVAGDITFTLNQNTNGSAGSISANNIITRANLTNGVARSVMGVTGNTSTSVADIQSTSADQVLVSTATSVVWGTVNTNGITNRAVTVGKIQAINTDTILGRTTASSGDIEQLTPATVTGMLTQFAGSIKGLVPTATVGDASKYLKGDGTWGTVTTGYTIETKTADTTYTTASGELIVLVNNGGGPVTITIPNANASTAKITIKKVGTSTANNLIINVTGGGTIDGDVSINLKLALQYTSVTLVSNGANWFII
jgi:hypothetical protein